MEAFLREIENLTIRPRNKLISGNKGNYRGTGFGDSLDFYGHRKYIAGDDIRKIDWKAYMRSSELYIREFTEQRELQLNIILDNSLSMDYGSPNKWETARILALGISYLLLKQMDNLNFYTLNDGLKIILENARGKEYFYKLLEESHSIHPEGKTDITSLIDIKNYSTGITVIISDLFGKGLESTLDYLCTKGDEVIVIHVISPSEIDPQLNEQVKLIDQETGEFRRINFDKKVKEIYTSRFKDYLTKLESLCTTREIKYVYAPTNSSPSNVLAKVFGGV